MSEAAVILIEDLTPDIVLTPTIRDAVTSTSLTKKDVDSIVREFRESVSLFHFAQTAYDIVVTDVSQKDQIDAARVMLNRLNAVLKQIEETRVAEGDLHLRRKQLYDQPALHIKTEAEPIIKHLAAQVNFARLEEERIKKALADGRAAELAEFGYAGSINMLGVMDDEQYQLILAGVKAQWEADQAAAIERMDAARKLADENARLREEKERADKIATDALAETKKLQDEADRVAAEKKAQEWQDAVDAAKAAAAPMRVKILAYADAVEAVEVNLPETELMAVMAERQVFLSKIRDMAENIRVATILADPF